MNILTEILSALEREPRIMLATIISTSGSTPASAFSKMLVKNAGSESFGTVGGGCMEGDVLQAAKRLYETDKAEILTFHLTEDEYVQGLICGGSVEVFVEPISKAHLPLFEELKRLNDEGEDCVLATMLAADGTLVTKQLVGQTQRNRGIMEYGNQAFHHAAIPSFQLEDELGKVFRRHETRRVKLPEGEVILEPVGGRPSLLLFGGGHVSKHLCRFATAAGFRVTVIDDRRQYANPERFPEAVHTLAGEYAETLPKLAPTTSTYVVIVTRGHRYDEEVLEWALKTPARSIGMIGSQRKVITTYERLMERGVPVEALGRVRAPVGLAIGAATAEEVAISIVAELIGDRRGEADSLPHKSDPIQLILQQLKKKEEVQEG
jgi:xanthine dehydrogenase accessory factor